MGKIEVGGRIYDALMDENGEPYELSRYDETCGIRITLCFNNASDGSVSDELLRSLKRRYLESFSGNDNLRSGGP